MILKNKTIALALASVFIVVAGYFLVNNSGSSEAKKVKYSAMSEKSSEKAFNDLKCLVNVGKKENVTATIIQEESGISPKGVKFRDIYVAIKERIPGMPMGYSMERISYRNGVCKSILQRSLDIGNDGETISFMYGDKRAQEIQYIWSKWQYDNIPGWKEYKQKELEKPNPSIAKEEISALKKLGFSIPKNLEEQP
jgi:hypothetical protein